MTTQRIQILLDIDIEREGGSYAFVRKIQEAVQKRLSAKKENHGDVQVYARGLTKVERAALALAEAIGEECIATADDRSTQAVDAHMDRRHY